MKACPICGNPGPWASPPARAAHIRSHHETTCLDCGLPIRTTGLDAHRAYFHATEPAPAPVPEPEPTPDPEPPAAADHLICPECGHGPCADRRGLSAHLRSHQTRPCPECHQQIGALGLGAHRRAAHGITGTPRGSTARAERATAKRQEAAAAEDERTRTVALMAAVADLMPEASLELVCRLSDFVAKHQPDKTLWVVATPTAGPWLCRVTQIGILAHRENVPVIAVSVDDIYRHLDSQHSAREAS